ncbi:uncharacterized protein A4U43_C03F2710 [Asparagus officinalis]|uniref:Uncharacterized protein n=1 Tax=Asparagus officinalis TaxID=4686 RepID=A0A5P1F7J7_ASPOF|nr:uncharacterized protein A4U43_C03F2710 [Asparagus officinalis]
MTDRHVEDSKNFIKICDDVLDTELETIRGKGLHFLDISKKKMSAEGNYIHDRALTVCTATELVQAGVSFKLADSICYSDISFTNGVLKLPYLCCHNNDVALLREAKIVSCTSGSDGDIASLFNRLTKGLPLLDKIHVHSENVNMKIENYYNRRRHKWRAIFTHTYLSNHWVFISLLAAIFLLALTFLQTIYTIIPFYKYS